MGTIKKGSATQMLDYFRNALDGAEGSSVESSTNTAGIPAKPATKTPITGGADVDMEYVNALIVGLQQSNTVATEAENFQFTPGDQSLTVSYTWMDDVISFDVPYSDLTFDYDRLDEDIAYVENSISAGIEDHIGGMDNDIEECVMSSKKVTASDDVGVRYSVSFDITVYGESDESTVEDMIRSALQRGHVGTPGYMEVINQGEE